MEWPMITFLRNQVLNYQSHDANINVPGSGGDTLLHKIVASRAGMNAQDKLSQTPHTDAALVRRAEDVMWPWPKIVQEAESRNVDTTQFLRCLCRQYKLLW